MPVQVLLEDFVPYDRSIQWRLHDAYFARRGIAAWTEGDVPYFSTGNYAVARQHALFLLAHVADLERRSRLRPEEDVHVLEVGSGIGQFAVNLFRALEVGTGKAGRALSRRLRYIFSDYSEVSVREALRSEAMRDLEARGRIAPALFDVRRPERLLDLAGNPFRVPLAAVYANYVCCVTHMKHLRKAKDGSFFEKHVRIHVEFPDPPAGGAPPAPAQVISDMFERPTKPDLQRELKVEHDWRPCDLDAVLADPLHAATARDAVAPLEEATVGYPYAFLDMVRGLRAALGEDGVVLVNDYGSSALWELRGHVERRPQHYGNTMNQGVDYAVFDAFARRAGMGILRTENPFRSVHVAALRAGAEVPPGLRAAFKAAFLDREDGEDMLDFGAAAKQWLKAEEPARAVRLYQRCLRLDPVSAETYFRMGEACLDAGYNDAAYETLTSGRDKDGARNYDFDFAIGRACYRLKRWREGVRHYRASLEREDDAVTHANLGVLYEEMGDFRSAYACYKRSAELRPDYERAKTLIRSLEEAWAAKTLGAKRAPADTADARKAPRGGEAASPAMAAAPAAPVASGEDGRSAAGGGVVVEEVSFGTPPAIPLLPGAAAPAAPGRGARRRGTPKTRPRR
jgi:tetratricopeptide (TPR) repeat protein